MNNYEQAFQELFNRVTAPENKTYQRPSKKRDAILQASKKLFSERGFSATTTAAIAKEAATTEKTLFKHFSSKNDLVLAVIVGAIADNFRGTQLSLYLIQDDLRQGLIDFLTVKHNAWMLDPAVLLIFLQVILTEKEIREALIGLITDQLDTEIGLPILKMANKLDNPEFDYRLFMVVLFGTMFSYSFTRATLLPDWKTDDKENIAKIVDMLLNGVMKKSK